MMRVLFLTHRLPYAPNRGDRIRAFHMLRHLASHAEVHLLSLVHDDDEASRRMPNDMDVRLSTVRVPALRNYLRGVLALGGTAPLTHVLLDSPDLDRVLDGIIAERVPDVVVAYGSGMARLAMSRRLSRVPFILDLVDVDSAKWSEYATKARAPMRWVYGREARVLGAFEREAASAAACVLVVNEREAEAARRLAPDARVIVIGNGVDVEYFTPPSHADRGPSVVFTAVFDYAPNVEGAVWLRRRVWPHVHRVCPDARLLLVGARPTARVRALGSTMDGVVVTGAVEDVRPFLWSGRVGVAPLHTARGLQNKVLEGIAAGLPFVVTPVVAAGLPAGVLGFCDVEDDPEAFARLIVGGLSSHQHRRMPAPRDLGPMTWPSVLAPLSALLATAARHPSQSPTFEAVRHG